MSLLKLGQTYLNLDLVTSLLDLSTRDGSGQVVQGLFRVEFSSGRSIEIAADAETLRAWINGNLATVPPATS